MDSLGNRLEKLVRSRANLVHVLNATSDRGQGCRLRELSDKNRAICVRVVCVCVCVFCRHCLSWPVTPKNTAFGQSGFECWLVRTMRTMHHEIADKRVAKRN